MELETRDFMLGSASSLRPGIENSHASNFHTLVAKLTREYDQTIFAFRQEIDHLRAHSMFGPMKEQQLIVSPREVSRDTTVDLDNADLGEIGQMQDQLISPREMSRDTTVDLDTADLDGICPEVVVMERKVPNCQNSHWQSDNEPSSFEGRNDCSKLLSTVVSHTESSQGMQKSSASRATSLSAQVLGSIRTPQAKMNWNLDELPKQDLWAVQVADFFSKWCPMCCAGETREQLERFLSWWEGLKEPTRSGVLYAFVEGNPFQFFILSVIFLNTIFVIITTNIDMDDALTSGFESQQEELALWRLMVESSFTMVYCIELLLKLKVHGLYLLCDADYRWNIFDFVLVIFSVVDLAFEVLMSSSSLKRPNLTFLRALRILKFARVLRMVRIVKCIHELKLMLDCVLHSVIHLFWSVVLILLVLIMFALLIVQGMRDYVMIDDGSAARAVVVGRFDTVQQTMLSLFMATTGGEDWGDQYKVMGEAGAFFEMVYVFYISFFTIVAWNIVMSSFVEKAFRLAMPDFETTVLEKRQQSLAYAKELTNLLICKLDQDQDGFISLDEFQAQLADPKVKDFFAARDLNLKDAELFFKMLLAVEHTNVVNVNTFVGACLRLRGLATAIDLQTLHFEVRSLHGKQERRVKGVEELLETILSAMSASRVTTSASDLPQPKKSRKSRTSNRQANKDDESEPEVDREPDADRETTL